MGRTCRGNFTVTNPRRCRPPTPVPEAKLLRLDRPSTIVVDVPHLPSAKDTPRRLALGSPQLSALRSSRRLDQRPFAWAKRHSVSQLVCSYLTSFPKEMATVRTQISRSECAERLDGASRNSPLVHFLHGISNAKANTLRGRSRFIRQSDTVGCNWETRRLCRCVIRRSRQGARGRSRRSLRHAGPRGG